VRCIASFKTKEEIVIAITERELGRIEDAVEAAEAEGHALRAREVLLDRMIDQAIERRAVVSVHQFDPVIIRLQAEHEPFQRFIERLYAALLGTEAGVEARFHAAMLSSAISVAVMHPLIADVDDDTLRAQLVQITRRILDLPEPTRVSAGAKKHPLGRRVRIVARRRRSPCRHRSAIRCHARVGQSSRCRMP
jgi:AcrR family transcriptional regulator